MNLVRRAAIPGGAAPVDCHDHF